MPQALKIIAMSLILAGAMIASSWLLKGHAAGEWVKGAFLVMIITLPTLFLVGQKRGGNCCGW